MEKIIIIDGKKVPLKVHAGCTRLYKSQFRRHLIHDLFKMKKLEKYIVDGELKADDEVIAQIDFEVFSDLLWLFAKAANPSIEPPFEWESQFTCIPLRTVLPEIMDLLTILLDSEQSQKKNLALVTR